MMRLDEVRALLRAHGALPTHEQRVKEILLEELPDVFLSVSHEVLPLYREFERFSTVALNAYVAAVDNQTSPWPRPRWYALAVVSLGIGSLARDEAALVVAASNSIDSMSST